MLKKISFALIMLMASMATISMNAMQQQESSSDEEPQYSSLPPEQQIPVESTISRVEFLQGQNQSISESMLKLRNHLLNDGGSYETADRIKGILVLLKNMRKQAVSDDFRESLEMHFDMVQAASQICVKFNTDEAVCNDKESYLKDLANAKANEMKINRFCTYLQDEYDVYKGGIPLLR